MVSTRHEPGWSDWCPMCSIEGEESIRLWHLPPMQPFQLVDKASSEGEGDFDYDHASRLKRGLANRVRTHGNNLLNGRFETSSCRHQSRDICINISNHCHPYSQDVVTEEIFPTFTAMNILPDAVGNVLHREIKRLLVHVESVEDKVASLEELQHREMIQVRRRLEKLEMDSEDIQDSLRRCLGERNFTSDTLVRLPPCGRSRNRTGSTIQFSTADKRKADEDKDEEKPEASGQLRSFQNNALGDTVERILWRMESLENVVSRIWNQQLTLREEIDWLRREYIVLGTKHKKELNELQLLVKTPEPSNKTSPERQSEIHIEEQPVTEVGERRDSANTARFHEEGWTVPEGISKMDHLQYVGLSLSNVMASAKYKSEGPRTSNLSGTFPQMSPFDLDIRSNTNKDKAENKAPEDRKSNMDIDTRVEDDLSTTLSVATDANQYLTTPNFFYESKKELVKFDQSAAGGFRAVQQHMHSNSHQNKKLEVSSNAQDHAAQRPGDSSACQNLEYWDLSSNVVAGRSRTDRIPNSLPAGSVSLDRVEDENAAKTHKVLEAYGIDVVVGL